MKRLCLTLVSVLLPLMVSAKVFVCDLKVENMTCPLGIDTSTPRFSWKLDDNNQEKIFKII